MTNAEETAVPRAHSGEAGEGENGGAQMARVCDGSTLPRADKSKMFLLRSFGNSGHEIWDVTDPAKPSRVLVLLDGLVNTHKASGNATRVSPTSSPGRKTGAPGA